MNWDFFKDWMAYQEFISIPHDLELNRGTLRTHPTIENGNFFAFDGKRNRKHVQFPILLLHFPEFVSNQIIDWLGSKYLRNISDTGQQMKIRLFAKDSELRITGNSLCSIDSSRACFSTRERSCRTFRNDPSPELQSHIQSDNLLTQHFWAQWGRIQVLIFLLWLLAYTVQSSKNC